MKRFIPLATFITILAAAPHLSAAAGIEVSPSKLDLVLNSDKITAELVVVNPTQDVQVFDVFADDYPDNIKSDPTSFTLEAGGRKKLVLGVRSVGLPNDAQLTTFVSVVATPLAEGRLQARTGVKIPVSLSIQKSSWYEKIPMWAYALLGGLAVFTASFALGRKFKLK